MSDETPAKHPGGRPTDYNEAIALVICERLADGESLRSICSDAEMPGQTAVYGWLLRHDEFAKQYARAREAQADTIADEILDIADDGSNDWMERHDDQGANIGWRENGEAIRRSQVRIDARKWLAGKMQPKKYGDRIQQDHTVVVDEETAVWLGLKS